MSIEHRQSIPSLVAALPEVYQPIYGHPEISWSASRECGDRLNEIVAVYEALSANHRRPLRVLDLGCAQGFISLSLAAQGAVVVGIDNLAANVAVCNALREANPTFDVQFREAAIESTIEHLNPGEFDLVLGLSVLHHLCHRYGKDRVREWTTALTAKAEIAVFELGVASEPLDWAKSLPEDERYLLDGVPFVHELSRFPTHLSEIMRPLYVCSSRYWYLDGKLGAFAKWTTSSHSLAGEAHEGTRRYFFGEGQLAKVFRLTGRLAKPNRDEIEQEAEFLDSPPPGFPRAPSLFTKGTTDREAWLAREALGGDLLIDLIRGQVAYDSRAILLDVLDQLCALEEVGLYHRDVRVWNVIVGPDGRASLIDFGAISKKREDCIWPSDVILSFVIFVRDVSARSVDRAFPRQPFISPYNLPDPFNRWILSVWHQPVAVWSFKLLRESLQNLPDRSDQPDIIGEAQALWIQAIERHLDGLGSYASRTQMVSSDLANQLSQVRTQIETLRQDLAAQLHAQQHAQALADARLQELQAIYSSRSWRMTAPLRQGAVFARRWVGRIANVEWTVGRLPRRWAGYTAIRRIGGIVLRPFRRVRHRVKRVAPAVDTRTRIGQAVPGAAPTPSESEIAPAINTIRHRIVEQLDSYVAWQESHPVSTLERKLWEDGLRIDATVYPVGALRRLPEAYLFEALSILLFKRPLEKMPMISALGKLRLRRGLILVLCTVLPGRRARISGLYRRVIRDVLSVSPPILAFARRIYFRVR
ncbi:MAG: methyltransferase domain-containing protein [Nitrospirota bacterium]